MKIEAGKIYVDSEGDRIFIVGKDKHGKWVGHLADKPKKIYLDFDEDGTGKTPNYRLVKEYREPITKNHLVYLWRREAFFNSMPIIETKTTIDEHLPERWECIGCKEITLREGEFSSKYTPPVLTSDGLAILASMCLLKDTD
jgi:hypothetical protein